MDIPEETFEMIATKIASEQSPVGIDAKHTHVLIIYKLLQIEKRLSEIEKRLEERD